MQVGKLRKALVLDDHGVSIRRIAKVRITDGPNEYDILSIYPSEDGTVLWIDIELSSAPSQDANASQR